MNGDLGLRDLGEGQWSQAGMAGARVGRADRSPQFQGLEGGSREDTGPAAGRNQGTAHHTRNGGSSATTTGHLLHEQMNKCYSSSFPQETQKRRH